MTNLIEGNKPTKKKAEKIYFYLFKDHSDETTKYNIQKSLELRNNDVYSSGNAFDLLEKKGYVEQSSKSDRGKPVYTATLKPIIKIINKKLSNIENEDLYLSDFEIWILEKVLSSDFFKKIVNDIPLKIINNEINAYSILFENILSDLFLSTYVMKTLIVGVKNSGFEPQTKKEFLDLWNNELKTLSEKEKISFNFYTSVLKEENKKIYSILLPSQLQDQYIISKDSLNFNSLVSLVALPRDLLKKTIFINDKAKYKLFLINDVLIGLLNLFSYGYEFPKCIGNEKIQKYIIEMKKASASFNKGGRNYNPIMDILR